MKKAIKIDEETQNGFRDIIFTRRNIYTALKQVSREERKLWDRTIKKYKLNATYMYAYNIATKNINRLKKLKNSEVNK